MTGQEINAWKDPIWDAVMRRIERRQSMTVNEILDELQPPLNQREGLVLFVRYLFAALEHRGYVTSSVPRRQSKQR